MDIDGAISNWSERMTARLKLKKKVWRRHSGGKQQKNKKEAMPQSSYFTASGQKEARKTKASLGLGLQGKRGLKCKGKQVGPKKVGMRFPLYMPSRASEQPEPHSPERSAHV